MAGAVASTPRAAALALVVCAGLTGCATEVATRVVGPVGGDCGATPGTTTLWGISSGECGVRPGEFVARGAVGEAGEAVAVPPGVSCFWGVAVDLATCEIRAGASVRRELPREREEVVVDLGPSACVDSSSASSWDAVVAELAGCSPSCAPARCLCGRAPACSEAVGTCPAALTGDLLRASTRWTCAAQTASRGIACWANAAGSRPVRIPTEVPVTDLAVGEELLCYVGPANTGRAAPGSAVRCASLGPGDVPPSEPAWRLREVPAALGSFAVRDVVARGLVVGTNPFAPAPDAEIVCAVFASEARTGVYCWDFGGVPPGDAPADFDFFSDPAGSAPRDVALLARPGTVAEAFALSGQRACVLANGAVRCVGRSSSFAGCRVSGGEPARDHVALEAAGGATCALRATGRLCCTADVSMLPASFTSDVDAFTMSAHDGGVGVCVRRFDGSTSCSVGGREVSFGASSLFSLGGTVLCQAALAELADRSLVCRVVGASPPTAAGDAFATSGAALPRVCPEAP